MSSQIKVELIWIDNGKQVGAKLFFSGQPERTADISMQEIRENYKGKINNADVMPYGLRGKPGVQLKHEQSKRNTGHPIATYTLMHAKDIVCRVYPIENRIEIVAGEYLPFALTGLKATLDGSYYLDGSILLDGKGQLTVTVFEQWLTARIDNLSRTYMNRVYIARKVGRDREKILRDSCAVSIIDNFWIKRSDVDFSWEELRRKRDKNLDLVTIALTGNSPKPPDFRKAEEDTTSLFALKGAFPKAVYEGALLKKDNNAEYEAVAYQLGSILGVSVAKAVRVNGMVECELFTSEAVSMAHARDLLQFTDYETSKDEHKALYDYFKQQGREDVVRQLERLYIFNYLVENTDFHYENFGFLYDSVSFKITAVAPAYDFNSAFGGFNDISVFYVWIFDSLPLFMRNHADLKERLMNLEFLDALKNMADLTLEQIKCVQARADYLCSL